MIDLTAAADYFQFAWKRFDSTDFEFAGIVMLWLFLVVPSYFQFGSQNCLYLKCLVSVKFCFVWMVLKLHLKLAHTDCCFDFVVAAVAVQSVLNLEERHHLTYSVQDSVDRKLVDFGWEHLPIGMLFRNLNLVVVMAVEVIEALN